MKKYIIGFAFNKDRSKLVLIKKNRPDWQAGKLNAVGGHLELYDASPLDGMVREFHEETGVFIAPKEWKQFGRLGDDINYDIKLFKAFTDNIYDVKTVTDEEINIFDVTTIPFTECISNIAWLVPMALEVQNKPINVDVEYDILEVSPVKPEVKKNKMNFNWNNPEPPEAGNNYTYVLPETQTMIDEILLNNMRNNAQQMEAMLREPAVNALEQRVVDLYNNTYAYPTRLE